ncbi:MAG: (Fe-S)-binding protein [Saprospiraceae bacterium]|nr:(Fe-S)-binding protein [Saprospiraceae bacterium]
MAAILIFILLLCFTIWISFRQYGRIIQNIKLGLDESVSGDSSTRWKRVLFVAFGQKKMFQNWLPAVLHLFIYLAFLLTQIELLEIIADGLTGHHRLFAPVLGPFYTFLISFIEILSLLAFIATVIFLMRRNLLHIPRFRKPEMKGWPALDANLILIGEILLITGIFSMNGADTILQSIDPDHYPNTGQLAISSWFGPVLFGGLDYETLHIIERTGWWLHLLVVLGFIMYLPFSKHLHVFFAFANTYFARLTPRGQMENMPAIMNEVKSMMGIGEATTESEHTDELPEFGANDVTTLSWRNLLEAYSCTECGRCTAVCPANLTGKKLSPRKIVMSIRDRAEEVGEKIRSGNPEYVRADARGDGVKPDRTNFEDGRSLFDLISPEEIHACTTCQACVEACPVLINPLETILKLRRHEILTQSAGPADWLPLFNSLENAGSAWQIAQDRDQWTRDLHA